MGDRPHLPPPPGGWGRPGDGANGDSRDRPWWRGRAVGLALAVLAGFVLGIGAAGGESGDAEARIAALTQEVREWEERVAASPGEEELEALAAQVRTYESEITELDNRLRDARAELDEARAEAATAATTELDEQVAELEEALRDAQDRARTTQELEALRQELDERASELDRREAALGEPAPAEPVSGCSAGQVDINTASVSELQRIHQVGPDRARQIVALRPFSSVDDLTRVSGIGPAHLATIKGQGLACVD